MLVHAIISTRQPSRRGGIDRCRQNCGTRAIDRYIVFLDAWLCDPPETMGKCVYGRGLKVGAIREYHHRRPGIRELRQAKLSLAVLIVL
jgi:hypothetical protein